MPKHITIDDSVHEMTSHSVQTHSWTGSSSFNIYSTASYNGARITMHVNDGTNHERVIFEIGNVASDTGFDETRTLLKGSQMSLNFSTAVVGNNLQLTIDNTDVANTTTIKYYVMANSL